MAEEFLLGNKEALEAIFKNLKSYEAYCYDCRNTALFLPKWSLEATKDGLKIRDRFK
jgi:hypothetical protein